MMTSAHGLGFDAPCLALARYVKEPWLLSGHRPNAGGQVQLSRNGERQQQQPSAEGEPRLPENRASAIAVED